MRIFSLIAGAAAVAVAVFRYVASIDGVRSMAVQVGNPEGALVGTVWHSLTYIMALVGAALLLSAKAQRETAQALALLATAIFGGITAIMLTQAWGMLGDPFAFYPVYLLGGLALVSGAAAAKA